MAAICVAVCDVFRCEDFREVHYGIHWRRWRQEQQSEFCEFLNGLLSMLLSLLHNKSFSFWRKKSDVLQDMQQPRVQYLILLHGDEIVSKSSKK
jgi:hypothetical protein